MQQIAEVIPAVMEAEERTLGELWRRLMSAEAQPMSGGTYIEDVLIYPDGVGSEREGAD